MAKSVKRLIRYFRPYRYQLKLTQNPTKMRFKGVVVIKGEVPATNDTEHIYLHSSDLIIAEVTVNGAGADFTIDQQNQEIDIVLHDMSEKQIRVEVSFSGTITQPMHGLYPCLYKHHGREKLLLTTQFESHHAREVFPCVDEPEAKATFLLHLTTPKKDVVVSNTPIQREIDKVRQKTTIFEETPIMSTYLLAWVSGELKSKSATTKSGVEVNAYSTPVHKGKFDFALDVATRALDFLEDYFGVAYPLPKCDIIALPNFASGAMENWGCITFRESAMLIDQSQSDLSDKQHVAEVVVHELAHQWFGNLVTMKWWNDLWLNEGFASWIPYLVNDSLYPEWNIWEHFADGDLATGLRADALEHTHPIVVEIASPEDIRSAFDSISYDKGCSVINLLYHFIGPDAFRNGLTNYLNKFAYKNAETDDLWEAWSESSGKNVAVFMNTWTKKPGFPIVIASEKDGSTALTQHRFLINPNNGSAKDTLWPIPLMRQDNSGLIMDKKVQVIDEAIGKLNSGQSGFYRVLYMDSLAKLVKKQIANGTMSAVDALGVISDSAEAAKAGYHSSVDVMPLIENASNYTSEGLINKLLGELAEIRMIMPMTYETQKPFLLRLVEEHVLRLGLDKRSKDSVDDELLRPVILATASFSGNHVVTNWLLEKFDLAKLPGDIRPDVRGVVYQVASRDRNDRKTYDLLWDWYLTSSIPGEQSSLASALCGFKDKKLFIESLGKITTSQIKLQDTFYWLVYSLHNRWHKQLAWQWLQSNWDWISTNFSQDKEIDYFLRFAASGFATTDHLYEYSRFFSRVDIHGSHRAFEQGKETITWQAAWRERDENKLKEWFSDNQ